MKILFDICHVLVLNLIQVIIHIFILKGVVGVDNDRVLKPSEVAEILKLSSNTVYKLLKRQIIPAVKIQHQYRILESELFDWLKSNIDSEITLD